MEKTWKKIYKYLDHDEYHINREYLTGHPEVWRLFKKYEGWLFDNSKPIMTSENSSLEDLLKYMKDHRRIDLIVVFNFSTFIISLINLALVLINLLIWRNQIISSFTLGGIIYLLVLEVIINIAYNKKMKIKVKNYIDSERLRGRIGKRYE